MLHLYEVAGNKCEVAAARAEHRRVDKELHNAAHRPHKADRDKSLGRRAEVGHRAEVSTDEKRRADEHYKNDNGAHAPDGMCAGIVALKVIFIHIRTSLKLYEHGSRHADEHAAGNGEAVDPALLFLFRKVDEKRHHSPRDDGDDKRHDIAGEGEQAVSRDDGADIAAYVRRDKADEHRGHGDIAEARSACTGLLAAAEAAEIALVEEHRQHHPPHDAHAHQKRNGGKGLRGHVRRREPAYADGLCRRLRDLRFIMQRADDGQSQPRPRCAEASGERDDAQKDADARQYGERSAGGDRALELHRVHPHGDTGAVGANHEHDAHGGDKGDYPAADGIHRSAVEQRKNTHMLSLPLLYKIDLIISLLCSGVKKSFACAGIWFCARIFIYKE